MTIGLTAYCFLAFAYSSGSLAGSEPAQPRVSWKNLAVLLVPFSFAYFILLLPRSLVAEEFDRYFPPLLFVGAILLLRFFQDRVQVNPPVSSVALTALFAIYAVFGTHDVFSLYRAQAAAFAEVRAAGVPATSIDGGLEQNGITQIESAGSINDSRIRVPATFRFSPPPLIPPACPPMLYPRFPALVPVYTLSYDPAACAGPSRFAPVEYRNWLAPHTGTVYIVNTGKVPSH
jgi:hypothetical protein